MIQIWEAVLFSQVTVSHNVYLPNHPSVCRSCCVRRVEAVVFILVLTTLPYPCNFILTQFYPRPVELMVAFLC